MRKIYLALALLCGSVSNALAQVGAYQFVSTTGTFTPVSSSATAVTAVLADDAFSASIPIGFNFVYNGVTYSSLFANSNGFLSFKSTATASASQQRANTAANVANVGPAIFPLWDDEIGYSAAPASSTAKYEVTGSPGSQVFTFEWKNWVWWYSATNIASSISFQAKLYEGTNVIEFIYQQESNGTLSSPTATIGLGGSTSTDYLTLSSSGSAPTTSSTTFTTGIATRPATGQLYRFLPPAPCVAPTSQPTSLAFSSVSLTSLSGAFTASSPAADRYLVLRTTTNTAPAPVNGTTYTTGANATLGANVEQYSNATSFSSSGLTAGTTYYYWVYSVSSACSGGPLYYNASPLTATVTTGVNRISAASGNWNDPATWVGGVVPTNVDLTTIDATHTVTVNSGTSTTSTLSINATGTLNVTGGSLNIGGTATTGVTNAGTVNISGGALQIGAAGSNNRRFANNSGGTLTVSNGSMTVYGNVAINTGSNLNQSGGTIIVDGNNAGSATNSVATGVPLFAIGTVSTQRSSGTVSLTGGSIIIVDPHTGAGANDVDFFYNGLVGAVYNITASPNHTLQFGNGVSTDAGNTNQFMFNFWAGESAFIPGNLVVDASTGTNRMVHSRYTPYIIGNNLVVNSGEFQDVSSIDGPNNRLNIGGNIVVNSPGTFTTGSSVFFANATYDANADYTLTVNPATSTQSISGNGLIRNSTTTPTAQFKSLFVNNSSGLNILIPLSISDTFSTNAPIVNLGSNTLSVGVSPTSPGAYLPASGYATGKIKRWIPAATGTYSYNLGTVSGARTATINFTNAPATGGSLTAEWVTGTAGTNGLPLTEGTINVSNVWQQGYWHIVAGDGLSGGVYTGTFTPENINGVNDFTQLVLLKRADELSPWTLNGTHVTTTGSNTTPILSRSGISGFSDFGVGSNNTNPLPVGLVSFGGQHENGINKLYWTTASETDNKGFILERSVDGKNFITIANFDSKAKNGNSKDRISYAYEDLQPIKGDNFYRLIQVNIDGRKTYSQALRIRVAVLDGAYILSAYPNPAKETLYLSIDVPVAQTIYLRITDISGREVSRKEIEVKQGSNISAIDISGFNAGIYLLHSSMSDVQNNSTVKFQKN